MKTKENSSSAYINYKPISSSLVETSISCNPLIYFSIEVQKYQRLIDVDNTQNIILPQDSEECLDNFSIRDLPEFKLLEAIDATIEPDDCGFLAKTIDLPIHSYGDNKEEAILNLKYNIQSLYEELMEDDNFSEEWINYKKYLKEIIVKKDEE